MGDTHREPAAPDLFHLPFVGEHEHEDHTAGGDGGILSEERGMSNCEWKRYLLLVSGDRAQLQHRLKQSKCL